MNKPWSEEELGQLEDPDQWDWEHVERVMPSKKTGAVVAVRFSQEEFAEVDAGAKRLGEKLTQFIREAALRRARSKRKQSRHG